MRWLLLLHRKFLREKRYKRKNISNSPKDRFALHVERTNKQPLRFYHAYSRRSALQSTTLLFTPKDQDRLRRLTSVHDARLTRESVMEAEAGAYDAVDLRLIDTFPASDAVGRY